MMRIFSIFRALLKTEMGIMVQYRVEMALWALWGVAYPVVAIAAWSAAARSAGTDGTIKGFGPHEFSAYFLITMIVGHCVAAWDLYEMGHLVQSGALSSKLMRPMLPIWEHLAANVGFKLLTLALLLPLWLLIAMVTRPAAELSVSSFLWGMTATVLAAAIHFLWGYTLGLSAFWFTRTDAISETWFMSGLFFGGRMAPLSLLPVPLQWIAAALPFKWVVWFPTAVFMGRVKGEAIAVGLLAQGFWLAAGLVVFPVLWRGGLKRYAAVGA